MSTPKLDRLHGHVRYLRSYFSDLPEPVLVALDNLIDVIKETKNDIPAPQL